MKKIFLLSIIALGALTHFAYAKNFESKNKTSQESVKESSKEASTGNQNIEEIYEKQKVKLKELDGTEWKIAVTANDKDRTKEEDLMVFRNSTVSIKSFEQKGFSAVGYTVTPDEEGEGASWENYQENKDGILAMTGKWSKGVMTGGISWVKIDGEKRISKTYSFTSQLVKDDKEKTADASTKAAASSEATPPATVVNQSNALVSKE